MERPRLTTEDIAHMAEGNSPATVALDYDEACTAMAQELLAIRRASQAASADNLQKLMGLSRWSPKGLPKNRGGVCMGIAKKGEWINRKEALIALGALRFAPAEVEA